MTYSACLDPTVLLVTSADGLRARQMLLYKDMLSFFAACISCAGAGLAN